MQCLGQVLFMCPIYLYVINDPPNSVYTAKRLNKRSLLLLLVYFARISLSQLPIYISFMLTKLQSVG